MAFFKTPEECKCMTDIRKEIDELDKLIIFLLGERFKYVQTASKFKIDQTVVRDPERVRRVMELRREWAAEQGLSPDVIENIYSDLINYSIQEEMNEWEKGKRQH